MVNKILSIIIPTYNMELYLKRCIDSLVTAKQTLGDTEIIVVNDGSKDKSLSIANGYKELYPESLIVIDKTNGNYGSCINAALKIASGKYIKVLDADDWFNTNALVEFVMCLKSLDVDLVLTDYTVCFENSNIRKKHVFPFVENKEYSSSLMHDSNFQKMQMHCVTYRTEMLRKFKYFQTEGISYTDQEWILYPMAYVRKISYFRLNLYQYLLGRAGQTMDVNILAKNVRHSVIIAERMVKDSVSWYKTEFTLPQRKYCIERMLLYIRSIYKLVLLNSDNVENVNLLIKLDDLISSTNRAFYKDLALCTIHDKFFPFHFINYFHNHHKRLPSFIKFINKWMKFVQNKLYNCKVM
jgi:glycosyltransferase involved in cell wall biosynthesis